MHNFLSTILFAIFFSTMSFAEAGTNIIPEKDFFDDDKVKVENSQNSISIVANQASSDGISYNIFDAFNLYNASLRVSNPSNAANIYFIINSNKSSLINTHNIATCYGNPAAINFINPFGFFLQNLTFSKNEVSFSSGQSVANSTIDIKQGPIYGAKTLKFNASEIHTDGAINSIQDVYFEAQKSLVNNGEIKSSANVHIYGANATINNNHQISANNIDIQSSNLYNDGEITADDELSATGANGSKALLLSSNAGLMSAKDINIAANKTQLLRNIFLQDYSQEESVSVDAEIISDIPAYKKQKIHGFFKVLLSATLVGIPFVVDDVASPNSYKFSGSKKVTLKILKQKIKESSSPARIFSKNKLTFNVDHLWNFNSEVKADNGIDFGSSGQSVVVQESSGIKRKVIILMNKDLADHFSDYHLKFPNIPTEFTLKWTSEGEDHTQTFSDCEYTPKHKLYSSHLKCQELVEPQPSIFASKNGAATGRVKKFIKKVSVFGDSQEKIDVNIEESDQVRLENFNYVIPPFIALDAKRFLQDISEEQQSQVKCQKWCHGIDFFKERTTNLLSLAGLKDRASRFANLITNFIMPRSGMDKQVLLQAKFQHVGNYISSEIYRYNTPFLLDKLGHKSKQIALSPDLERQWFQNTMFQHLGYSEFTIKDFYSNALEIHEKLGLVVGKMPSRQQQQQLLSGKPIYWPVENEDGYLAPVLIFDEQTRKDISYRRTNAFLAKEFTLKVDDEFRNEGIIQSLRGNINIVTETLYNNGDLISAEDVELMANKELFHQALFYSSTGIKPEIKAKGKVRLQSKGNITVQGADIEGASIKLLADKKVVAIPRKLYQEFKREWAYGVEEKRQLLNQVNSFKSTQGNIEIKAKEGDVDIEGGFFASEKDLVLKSEDGTVKTIAAVDYVAGRVGESNGGFFSHGMNYANYYKDAVIPVFMEAKGNFDLQIAQTGEFISSIIKARNFNLRAENNKKPVDIKFKSIKELHIVGSSKEKNHWGIYFTGNGVDFFKSEKNAEEVKEETNIPTIIQIEDEFYGYASGKMYLLSSSIEAGKVTVTAPGGIELETLKDSVASFAKVDESGTGIWVNHNIGEISVKAGAHHNSSSKKSIDEKAGYRASITAKTTINLKGDVDTVAAELAAETVNVDGDIRQRELHLRQDNVRFATKADAGINFGIQSSVLSALFGAYDTAKSATKKFSVENTISTLSRGVKTVANSIDALDNPLTGGWWASTFYGKVEERTEGEAVEADKINAKNININSENYVDLSGVEYQADNININTKYLNIFAAKVASTHSQCSNSVGGQMPVYGSTMPSASAQGHCFIDESVGYKQSILMAANKMSIKAANAHIAGANIEAGDLVVDFGNLILESLKSTEKTNGGHGGVILDPSKITKLAKMFKGGSLGATSANKSWLEQMTTLIGHNSAKVVVQHTANVVGAAIANAERDEDGNLTDKGNLQFSSAKLIAEKLNLTDDLIDMGFGAFVGNKEFYKSAHVEANFAYRDRRETVDAAIGKGELNADIATDSVNRDINKKAQVIKDFNIDPVYIYMADFFSDEAKQKRELAWHNLKNPRLAIAERINAAFGLDLLHESSQKKILKEKIEQTLKDAQKNISEEENEQSEEILQALASAAVAKQLSEASEEDSNRENFAQEADGYLNRAENLQKAKDSTYEAPNDLVHDEQLLTDLDITKIDFSDPLQVEALTAAKQIMSLDIDAKIKSAGTDALKSSIESLQNDDREYATEVLDSTKSYIAAAGSYAKGFSKGVGVVTIETVASLGNLLLHPINSAKGICFAAGNMDLIVASVATKIQDIGDNFHNWPAQKQAEVIGKITAEVLTSLVPVGTTARLAAKLGEAANIAGKMGKVGAAAQRVGRKLNKLSSKALSKLAKPIDMELVKKLERRGWTIDIAKKGSDDYRYLTKYNIDASINTGVSKHILLKEGASKSALLEEFLHGTQLQLGLLKKYGSTQALEVHVKNFMLRHAKILGLNNVHDIKLLQQLKIEEISRLKKITRNY